MSDLRQKMQELTTEELEAILREDFHKTDRDSGEELVLCVLDILEQRQKEQVPSVEEAYASFQKNYLPGNGESLFAPLELRGRKRAVRWAAGIAAAAAAVALAIGLSLPRQNSNVPTEPPVIQQTQPRQFTLQNLSENSVAITDEDGKQAAVGTVELDRYTISASIQVTGEDAQAYDYCAVVTFSYIPVGGSPGQMAQVQFMISTAEGGGTMEISAFPSGQIGRICSAEIEFSAVAKDGQVGAVIRNPYMEILAPA